MICTSLPAQLAQQLHVVVAGHAERAARLDHRPSPAAAPRESGPRSTRSPRKTALRPSGGVTVTRSPSVLSDCVAELLQQLTQFVEAAMHVADDVERAVLVLAVVPERLALDRRGVDLLRRGEHEDVAEALALQAAQRAPQIAAIWLRTTCGPKSRSGRAAIALLADASPAGRRRWRPAGSDTAAPARPAACAPPAARWSRRPRSVARRPGACAAMKCSTSKASFVAA